MKGGRGMYDHELWSCIGHNSTVGKAKELIQATWEYKARKSDCIYQIAKLSS